MWNNIVSSVTRFIGPISQAPTLQSSLAKILSSNTSVLNFQVRHINKEGYASEPGWKAIGQRWLVKFPEDGKYTIKKLKLMKLAGRDPKTGNAGD